MSDHADLFGGIPKVTLVGTPRAIGEGLGERLKARLEVLSEYLTGTLIATARLCGKPLDVAGVRDLVRPAANQLVKLEPSLAMEFESLSRSSGVRIEDLLVIHGHTDLLARLDTTRLAGPSTFIAVPANHTQAGAPLQILVWECDPALLPYLTLVHRIPSHGPASLSLTLAGLHPIAFTNEAGLSVMSNTLMVNDGTDGHFTTSLLAAMANAPAFGDARARATRGPRWAGRAIHLLAADGHRLSVELSGHATAELTDKMHSVTRVHTNHPLTDELHGVAINDDFSRVRLEQIASRAVRARDVVPTDALTWFGLDRSKTEHGGVTTPRQRRGLVVSPESCLTIVADPQHHCLYVRRGYGSDLETKAL